MKDMLQHGYKWIILLNHRLHGAEHVSNFFSFVFQEVLDLDNFVCVYVQVRGTVASILG